MEDYLSVVLHHSSGHKIAWLYSTIVQFCLHLHAQQTASNAPKTVDPKGRNRLYADTSSSRNTKQKKWTSTVCQALSPRDSVKDTAALHAQLFNSTRPPPRQGIAVVMVIEMLKSVLNSIIDLGSCEFPSRHSCGFLPAAEGNTSVLPWEKLKFSHLITHQIQIQSKGPGRPIGWHLLHPQWSVPAAVEIRRLAHSIKSVDYFLTMTPWVWVLFTM